MTPIDRLKAWADQSGEKRASYEVTAVTVRFLSGGAEPHEAADPVSSVDAAPEEYPF